MTTIGEHLKAKNDDANSSAPHTGFGTPANPRFAPKNSSGEGLTMLPTRNDARNVTSSTIADILQPKSVVRSENYELGDSHSLNLIEASTEDLVTAMRKSYDVDEKVRAALGLEKLLRLKHDIAKVVMGVGAE